ncbi:MAG: Ldh family oxidoreductase, partial [Dehalococcoidales bacterium]|nr:Ldh family oxidoreductase [Dehalococcoidales bacterium]
MPGVEGGVLFPADKLRAFTVAVFEKVGVSPEDAAVVTDSLIEANLRGVDTHGITRMLCVYIKRLQVGVMSPRTEWSIARENASTALIDAKNSLGQVVATRAMQLAISKAKQTGIGFTAVNHANHYGAAAYYSMMALGHDMIGFSSTNAPAGVAPWGGRQPILGTNPFSYALPAGEEEPVVLDMATTVVARGRLLLYAKQKGCKIGLITNGSAFTERNSLALLEAGVDMIEFSVDACDEATYAVVRKGLKWDRLLRNARRMIEMRNRLGSNSKIIASGVNQQGVDIVAVERFWRDEIGVDNFISRKFLTWGVNTRLDGERSADPAPYLDVEATPCPFIFERLNIDSRGNVMVCGYDIAANTSMGRVGQQTIKDIWQGEGFRY